MQLDKLSRLRLLSVGMDGFTTNPVNFVALRQAMKGFDITLDIIMGMWQARNISHPIFRTWNSNGALIQCSYPLEDLIGAYKVAGETPSHELLKVSRELGAGTVNSRPEHRCLTCNRNKIAILTERCLNGGHALASKRSSLPERAPQPKE